MTRKLWTDLHDDELRAHVRAGRGTEAIATAMGFSRKTVQKKRQALDLQYTYTARTACPGAVAAYHAAGWSDNRQALAMGITHETVRCARVRLGLSRLSHEVMIRFIKAANDRAAAMASGWPKINKSALARWNASMGDMVNHGTDEDPDWRCTRRLMEEVVTVVRRPRAFSRPAQAAPGCSAYMCTQVAA